MRTLTFVPVLFAVLTGVAFTGCGTKEDDKDDDEAASELEGTWSTACVDEGTGDPKTYVTISETFSGSKITSEYTSFSDATCATKLFSLRMTGSFESGDTVTTPAGAKTLDIDPSGVYLTPRDANYVKSFNGETAGSTAFCGGGYVINVEKLITNELCKDNDNLKTVENKDFGIYKIDGDKLYEGNGGDAGSATDSSAATKRPTVLETTPKTKK